MTTNYPHLRIDVVATYQGKEISFKEIDKNEEIQRNMPSLPEVNTYYMKIWHLANTNDLNYRILISESGFELYQL
jgi:hypothetical protein